MEFPIVLARHLSALTEALDNPGTDLQAVLAVLADDLRGAVSSFLGLTMTVYASGAPITLAAVDPRDALGAGATLLVPLDPLGAPAGSTVLFYAANPGSFVDLGADTRNLFGLDGQVVIDGHLATDPGDPGVAGFNETTAINRAVGILIERGKPPPEARLELRRLAADADGTVLGAAEQLLQSATGPSTDGKSGPAEPDPPDS